MAESMKEQLDSEANRIAAAQMTRAAGEASQLHADGNDRLAETKQEWGAINASQPAYDENGKEIKAGPTRIGVKAPESDEIIGLGTVDPQEVRNILHEEAIKEDEARAAAAAAEQETKRPRSLLGRFVARFSRKN